MFGQYGHCAFVCLLKLKDWNINELNRFYQSLMHDVVFMYSGDEDGNIQE